MSVSGCDRQSGGRVVIHPTPDPCSQCVKVSLGKTLNPGLLASHFGCTSQCIPNFWSAVATPYKQQRKVKNVYIFLYVLYVTIASLLQ